MDGTALRTVRYRETRTVSGDIIDVRGQLVHVIVAVAFSPSQRAAVTVNILNDVFLELVNASMGSGDSVDVIAIGPGKQDL
jgi:hypothetical protein